MLQDRVKQAITYAQRSNTLIAILFIDLDHFKKINDTLGHHLGDKLLQQVANHLKNCVRESDSVARLGGDEFVICLSNLFKGSDASIVAKHILDVLTMPFQIEAHELHVTCSIGICIYPTDGMDEPTLMRNADAAMYSSKEQGRNNYKFFAEEISDPPKLALNFARKTYDAES